MIVRALDSEQFDKKDISVIAKSSERFIQLRIKASKQYLKSVYNEHLDDPFSWSLRHLGREVERVGARLIDSNEFLHAPLQKLASALEKEKSEYFTILRQAFHVVVGNRNWKVTDEDMQYMLKKLPFPYKFLSSEDVIKPGRPLPERHWFNNDLTREQITDEEWAMQWFRPFVNDSNLMTLRSMCVRTVF